MKGLRTAFINSEDIRISRINTPQENETTSVMQRAQYDEIDSLYYNPMNDIITQQGVIQNQQETSGHVDIIHSRIGLHHHSNSQEIALGADYSLNILEGNLSGQSSSDESYLVPFQQNIVAEEIVNEGLNETQGEQLDIDIDDLSVASESSETNAKSVKNTKHFLQ
ncbi:unnamed protein product [Mytilus edulis]|uniref:Uncharacterized protein n=1 Tax=Mytilus edulis TaxID=6550 RepID=A0A8S3Q2V5_MYTED|nr:unnamed protein product [Mytilus edulis]